MSNRSLAGSKQQAHLLVESLPIEQARSHPRNPRGHSSRQIAQLCTSIATFGFNSPILIDEASQVVAGHARLEACRQLGWTEVPAIRLHHLTAAQAKAYMLADNKLAENATWDTQLLGEVLHELSVIELNFSLDAIGFEMGEIDFLIETARGPKASEKADKLPPPFPGPVVTELGDIWQLDGHGVFCGSALEEASYTTLMDGAQAGMVFTDPPYNVPIRGHVSSRDDAREFVLGSGELNSAGFMGFLRTAVGHHAQHGSLHFVCMDWRHMGELLAAGTVAYGFMARLQESANQRFVRIFNDEPLFRIIPR